MPWGDPFQRRPETPSPVLVPLEPLKGRVEVSEETMANIPGEWLCGPEKS